MAGDRLSIFLLNSDSAYASFFSASMIAAAALLVLAVVVLVILLTWALK